MRDSIDAVPPPATGVTAGGTGATDGAGAASAGAGDDTCALGVAFVELLVPTRGGFADLFTTKLSALDPPPRRGCLHRDDVTNAKELVKFGSSFSIAGSIVAAAW